MTLRITDNVTRIEKEVRDGDFNLNLKDHILYLPSFINPDVCKDVVNNLKNVGLDKSTPYTCLLYTSPSPRDATLSRMPSSA